ERMAGLLAEELERRGFRAEDGNLVREQDDTKVSVNPRSGDVTVTAERSRKVELQKDHEGRAYEDFGPHAQTVREGLREEARKALEKQVANETARLQTEVTDRLERQLADIRRELDDAVNRVTGEA